MKVKINDIIKNDFKNLSDGSGKIKEYMGEMIVMKARGLKSCGSIFTRYMPKFYMSPDPEYGNIKVKFKASYYDEYKVSIGDMTYFDTLIIIGLNKKKNIIEKIFAIPEKELNGKKFITITNTTVTYQKFEIDKKRYVQIYEDMKNGKCLILEDGSVV